MEKDGCQLYPYVFQCSKPIVWVDPIIGIILTLPILYLASFHIRDYFINKSSSTRNVASFYILTAVSQVPSIVTRFCSVDIMETYIENFQYDFQIFCQIFSYCLVINQAALILVNLNSKFSNLLQKFVRYVELILILSIVIFAFLIPVNFYPHARDSAYQKLMFYTKYFVPYAISCDMIVGSLFLIVTTLAFVFTPGLQDFLSKKLITVLRVLIFFVTFFFILWIITYKFRNEYLDFIHYFSINNIDFGMKMTLLLDLICWYLPSILFSILMYSITHDDISGDIITELDQNYDTVTASLDTY